MAPEAFEKCVKQGGRVRTISGPNKMFGLEKNQYKHICFLKNKSYPGETKTKKENSK
jgi:hypothetical protein